MNMNYTTIYIYMRAYTYDIRRYDIPIIFIVDNIIHLGTSYNSIMEKKKCARG